MAYLNRILVVDDDIIIQNLLEVTLDARYEVVKASTGQEALEILAGLTRLDLILLDVKMPGMSGYELHEKIKELPVCYEIPVVYLTGLTRPEAEIKGLGAGAADFITKPFDPSILLARVENRLRSAKRLDMRKISSFAIAEEFTDMELNILQCVALSMSNDEIADNLGYSYGHIKNVLSRLFIRLDIGNRRDIKEYLL